MNNQHPNMHAGHRVITPICPVVITVTMVKILIINFPYVVGLLTKQIFRHLQDGTCSSRRKIVLPIGALQSLMMASQLVHVCATCSDQGSKLASFPGLCLAHKSLCKTNLHVYSGTSLNGHSLYQTPHYTGQNLTVQIELALHVILWALRNSDTSLFYEVDSFCSPASTSSVQDSLNNVKAGRLLAQDCPAPLIDSPTGHHANTSTHSSSLWLSFLVIVQQGRAMERGFVALNCTSTPTENKPETSEVGTPSYSGHFRWHQWCPHYRGSTVVTYL